MAVPSSHMIGRSQFELKFASICLLSKIIFYLFIYLFYQFLVFAHYAIKSVNSLRSGEKLISEPMKQPSQ